MSDISTWHERAMRHPDHQSGMVSEGMIRARMCEEIEDLRAEVERQARHIEELRDKIDAEKSCCCSFDALGDVCAAHSPALTQALAEVERLTRERDEARAEVERLRDENATLRRDIGRMTSDRDAQRAAIKEPRP